MSSWLDYFTDPILRGPNIGCILMCLAASLMGVVLFLQKRLLLSESISHATYPGAIFGVFLLSFLGPEYEGASFIAVLAGALISSAVGLKMITYLQKRWRVQSDAALCFCLSFFFGVGVLLASALQGTHPLWMQQVQILLFGQAATLNDTHLLIYGFLALGSSLFVAFSFRFLQAFLFDPGFSKSVGIPTRSVEKGLFWLLLFSIILGIRSVGIILLSGMLIAPAIAARQFSRKLKTMFFLSAFFGAASGFLGNVLSVELAFLYPSVHLPTGPSIVLVGSSFALFSMLFSPQRGFVFRLIRRAFFQLRCLEENVLKELWKKKIIPFKKRGSLFDRFVFFRLIRQGWVTKKGRFFALTADGSMKAASIIRLHRLWEVYLTDQLGLEREKVHKSAEEIEHILTPELEKKLTRLLSNPQSDPHQQPIPPKKASL